jgi:hypothetical protein
MSKSRVSSGSIVSDYGLDDRAIEVRSPAGVKDFSSNLCVQTGSGSHPASCTMGTGGPFPGGKARPGRDADHSPHLVPRSWIVGAIPPLPPSASMVCSGTALLNMNECNHMFTNYINISQTVFAANAHLTEGQVLRANPTANRGKYLNF